MARPPHFLLLLLLLGRLARGSGSTEAPGDLEYQLPRPHYETEGEIAGAERIPGALRWLPSAFLGLVMPKAFPEDILREVYRNKFEFRSSHDSIIAYELGVLICVSLGLLFITLMPLVGLCFCLCRCLGKCGGAMHQREKAQGPALRRYFAVSLLVISILISGGIVCVFIANHYMRNLGTSTWKLADSNINDLRTFLNSIPEQIDYMVEQYHPTKERAFSDLDNIRPLLGDRIHEALKPTVSPVLTDVLTMAQVIRRTKEGLTYVTRNLTELKTLTRRLGSSLRQVQGNLEQTLNNDCRFEPSCSKLRSYLSDLDDNSTVAQLPSLDDKVNSINNVDRIDLFSLVKRGNETFNDIPKMVEKQTQVLISDIKEKLNSSGHKLDNIRNELPIHDLVSKFSKHLDDAGNSLGPYLPLVERYNLYRWIVTLILCFLLALIVTFYFLGLLCGTVGYDKRATPTTRGLFSNTGGIFLMIGVGLSFLVCWVIMAFVLLTFVLGGNVQKLVCEPYQSRKLFQVLDTPYLLNERWKYYLSGLILDDPEVPLTFEDTYRHCKENRGAYATLKLEQKYNMTDMFSIEKLTGPVRQHLEDLQVDLSRVVLLDDSGVQGLRDCSSSGVREIDYNVFLTEINKPPTRGNLLLFAAKVETEVNNFAQAAQREALLREAQEVRRIHQELLAPQQQASRRTDQSLRELQAIASNLEEKVDSVISTLASAQDFIHANASSVVRKEIQRYVNSIIEYFELYLQWVRRSITEEVAACKPVATALDSTVEILLCRYIVDPLNLFWFGLGEATFLLLPALIFAVKLAKYYRRMQSEDVYYDKRHAIWGLHRHYPMWSL
ncbi:prominin-1 isoform X2 [Sorex araneus]|uniref:prominin-1 isoform X2 n=1 Tax=Sorex araneus TaxID=42254 RepID=UPI002433C90A|nr:prominin-1 isoform X2 [Sorex araneus]